MGLPPLQGGRVARDRYPGRAEYRGLGLYSPARFGTREAAGGQADAMVLWGARGWVPGFQFRRETGHEEESRC